MSLYTITYPPDQETALIKVSALRRAAAIAKFYKGIVKVYDSHRHFVKSFDGRK